MAADTPTAIALLNESHHILLDPLEGPGLHAELLYYSIKQSNIDVIKYLINLCVSSDVSFYHFCGRTPAGLALEEGLTSVLPLIVEKTDHQFALYTAVQLKQTGLKDLLLKSCVFKDKFLKYLGISKSF